MPGPSPWTYSMVSPHYSTYPECKITSSLYHRLKIPYVSLDFALNKLNIEYN